MLTATAQNKVTHTPKHKAYRTTAALNVQPLFNWPERGKKHNIKVTVGAPPSSLSSWLTMYCLKEEGIIS